MRNSKRIGGSDASHVSSGDVSNGDLATRRGVLRGLVLAPTMTVLSAPRFSRGVAREVARENDGGSAYDERASSEDAAAFLDAWEQAARRFVAEPVPNEERFVHELCAALAAQDPRALPTRRFTVYDADGMRTGPVGRDDVFQPVEIELDPGVAIPIHNHVGYTFVSLCVAGSAHVRHFEPLADMPPPSAVGEELVVREVATGWLVPGRVSTLTRSRANLHGFVAGEEGCRLLDFGVKHPEAGPGPEHFSVCELEGEAQGAHTFRARWLGNIYAKQPPETK